ncbi:MAG: polyprenyl synthetase family protein [Proteobacteria bacterium]|nr:polyprenyl synthetase family protein [Pseudomonadota bacterium]
MDIRHQQDAWCERLERKLHAVLPSISESPSRLHRALRYSVLNGGKRLRPMLVYATGEMLGVPAIQLDAPAVAVELIHCYSLVHDDLPVMDDDDLRRGRPTTHRQFDEATAVLVGDALQMLAFEILATDRNLPADAGRRLQLVTRLAQAGGSRGMTGGQALDLAAEHCRVDIAELETIHRLKTGRLLQASVLMGAALSPHLDRPTETALARFGDNIGLAFQVRDDLLDVESDTETLGKTAGSDAMHGKATYPALLGVQASRNRLDELYKTALAALDIFGAEADVLRELARQSVERRL